MINFLAVLSALCALAILVFGNHFIAPVLAGLVLASGLRPLLQKFPLSRIKSPRLRSLTLLITFIVALGAMTTYVVIASARGIVRNVDFKSLPKTKPQSPSLLKGPDDQILERDKDSDEEAKPVVVETQESPKEATKEAAPEPTAPKSFTEKVKGFIQKIPGMNADDVTRTWSDMLSSARGLAFAFLSRILTSGPALFLEWVVFLLSFIMFFWNYELFIGNLRKLQSRYPEVKDCLKFFENSTQATLIGTLTVGFAQGTIVSIGTAIAGFDSFILLGLCAFFASFVPFFGTATVWGSTITYCLINGDTQGAVIVLVTGCISAVADNLILPTLVGSKNRVNPLLLFIVVLGMIDFIGIWGLFLGPVLSIFATRVIELWFSRLRTSKA